MQDTLIDLGLLVFATFFILIGVVQIMRGVQERSRRFAYDVGRMNAAGKSTWQLLSGAILLSVGVVLFSIWAFDNPTRSAAKAQDEPIATRSATKTRVKPTLELLRDRDGENENDTDDENGSSDPEAETLQTIDLAQTPVAEEDSANAGATETNALEQALPTRAPTEIAATPTLPLPATIAPIVPTNTPLPTPIPTPIYDGTVNIIGGLNMRAAPEGAIVTLLENGSGVFFAGGNVEQGNYVWIEVETPDGQVGWVAQDFIVPTAP